MPCEHRNVNQESEPGGPDRGVGDWDGWIGERVARLRADSLLREPRPLDRTSARTVLRDGRELVNFASNDYLGLARHPALLAASQRDLRKGAGSTASRLMAGTDHDYAALEDALAWFKGTDSALVFGSGYLANIGTIPALVGRHDTVFVDRLNHASIVDGARISGAHIMRFSHLDMQELDRLLGEAPVSGRKLIVTESLFGMDGDFADLEQLVALKQRHRAALMLDEAHSVGVYGPQGRGWAHAEGLAGEVDLHMGTLSKAMGLYGGYVAGRSEWIRYLKSAARSFVYTTALPPVVVGGAGAALELVMAADRERRRVGELAARFRRGLVEQGMAYAPARSQIQPVVLGSSVASLQAGASLAQAGVLAVPIRPPTVPSGAARLRFSINAAHTEADIDMALGALATVLEETVVAG